MLFCRCLLTVGIVFIAALSCTRLSTREQNEYITIGALFPITGEYCDEGVRALNGVMMARNDINKSGGLLGKPVDVIALNDRNDERYIVEQYKALREKGVVAVIGSSFSGASIALAKAAAEDGIPVISPTASSPRLTERRGNVFRVVFLDDHQARVMASYACGELRAKTALLIDDGEYSQVLGMFAKEFEECGGKILSVERYDVSANDFDRILAKHKRNPPDIIYCPTDYRLAAQLVETAHRIGLRKTNLLGTDAWDGILAFLHDPDLMAGIYYTSAFSSNIDDPRTADFSQRYFDNYSQAPLDNSALSYSAMQILAAAITKAGGTKADDIIKTIKANEVETVAGRIGYDANNNPSPDVYIVQVRDGAYSVVKKANAHGEEK